MVDVITSPQPFRNLYRLTSLKNFKILPMCAELTVLKWLKLLDLGKITHLGNINDFLSHPTTCSSAADLLAVLFFHPDGMHYHPDQPKNFANDRFVLSKGHAAPLLYSLWYHNGFLTKESLSTLRRIDSPLEGHPTPKLDFVDVGTGSLGQGLSVACGMAYASKYIDKIPNRYYCMMGDGETVEGSVWEAAHFAAHYKLDNLTAIVDVNGLGQSGYTSLRVSSKRNFSKCFRMKVSNPMLTDSSPSVGKPSLLTVTTSMSASRPSKKPERTTMESPSLSLLRPSREETSLLTLKTN